MSLVGEPSASTRGAERLTGAGPCPNGAIVGPTGLSESIRPDSDPCEEMALRVASQVVRSDIDDAPFVHVAGRDQPTVDQFTEPRRCLRVDFVIPDRQRAEAPYGTPTLDTYEVTFN